MSKCFNILSIDGGGIKGLYSAVILEKIEEEYGPIYQHFDLICGTSTGGIIALALASGVPARDVVGFYRDRGPLIFPYHQNWHRKLHFFKSILLSTKYKDDALKTELEKVFGNTRIEDCKANVLIPSVNITTGKPYVFKSDHNPTLTRDNKRLLTEVALATAAAPTYFPIVELETEKGREQFVDGGLWANNPSLAGIQEFVKFYKDGSSYHDYCLLSISALHERTRFPDPQKVNRRKSFYKWGDRLISLMIDSQSEAVHNQIEYLRSYIGGSYVRIPSMELSESEKRYITLDGACPKSLRIMLEKGIQAADQWIGKEELKTFFNNENREDTRNVKLS
ncbi:CBASS cGAMP-activated phospholipase [Brevibacillus sp. NPDC003359]|uniref:CBASS cGAMP-activated phospholipase n=1 Tax=unclassified Brevibacillus TaxID=2684853 RepID=UPI0036C00F4B